MSSEEMHPGGGHPVQQYSTLQQEATATGGCGRWLVCVEPKTSCDDFIQVKGRPPPYTDGEVTTTSGVVYQAQPAPTVIPVLVANTMSPKPAAMTCPSCNQEIVTRVEYKATTKTHLFAVLLCIVFWPCVCLPYCIPNCRNADHYCPNCSAYIGSYNH